MGLRTWLYKNTGIKLRKFAPPEPSIPLREYEALQAQHEALQAQHGALQAQHEVLQIQLATAQEKLDQTLHMVDLYAPKRSSSYAVREEFKALRRSEAAAQKLLDDFEFNTVLDIGAGALEQSILFSKHGKQVTAIDFGVSVYYKEFKTEDGASIRQILGDFNQIELDEQFDCVWASHILEHQPDVDVFLKKLVSLTKENGLIAITVPAFDHVIVGGHMSLWNAGLILYRLVLLGVNCAQAHILSYGDNISVIVQKQTIHPTDIEYDCGDLRRIKNFLPQGMIYYSNPRDEPYNGNIEQLNWQ